MGKKPKAPDMSFQVEAAQKQEAELARQRAETDAKNQQVAMANTDKLRSLRRRQSGRDMAPITYVPAGAPAPVVPTEAERIANIRDKLRGLRRRQSGSGAVMASSMQSGA